MLSKLIQAGMQHELPPPPPPPPPHGVSGFGLAGGGKSDYFVGRLPSHFDIRWWRPSPLYCFVSEYFKVLKAQITREHLKL